MFNRILAKLKKEPNHGPFMVYRQDNGYPNLNDSGMDEGYSDDELLFPDLPESGRDVYGAAALQGLLANPNIVKNLKELDQDEDMTFDLLRVVDKLSAWMYYGGCVNYVSKINNNMGNNVPRELSYYGMYLRKFLEEIDSPKKNDETFINERADAAEIEYEERRRDGMSVFEAQELAMAVLVAGISEDI